MGIEGGIEMIGNDFYRGLKKELYLHVPKKLD